MAKGPFIRERTLRGYLRETQSYTAWHEWQVVDGRKIISRHELKHQAERALAKYLEERSPA